MRSSSTDQRVAMQRTIASTKRTSGPSSSLGPAIVPSYHGSQTRPSASDLRAVRAVLAAGPHRRRDDPAVARELIEPGLGGEVELGLHGAGERDEERTRLVDRLVGQQHVEDPVLAIGGEVAVLAGSGLESRRTRADERRGTVRSTVVRRAAAAEPERHRRDGQREQRCEHGWRSGLQLARSRARVVEESISVPSEIP